MNLPLDKACRYIDTGKHGKYRYVLLQQFLFWHAFGFTFTNDWITIDEMGIELASGYSCDGATWAPDLRFVMPAVFIHDAMYQYAEEIATSTHKTVKAVLEIADKVFLAAMLSNIKAKSVIEYCGKRALALLYYHAVDLLGYRYHEGVKV